MINYDGAIHARHIALPMPHDKQRLSRKTVLISVRIAPTAATRFRLFTVRPTSSRVGTNASERPTIHMHCV